MAEASNVIVAGQYEIGERIRQDAVSTLYAARDVRNNRKVWIKVVSPGLASDKKFVEQFQQEAKTLAELKSSQIPQVLDAGVDGDTYYIVLEPAAGKMLAAILREEGTLEVEQAMKIAEQVAWCLHALGQKGLVHRGINPGNILITPAEEVMVLDFGLMRGSNTSGMSFTEVSTTPDYISPELVEGGQAIDVRSDIYTLGVTLYAMLAGEVPYRGNNPMDIIMKHLSAPIPSLRAIRPDTPPEVDAVVKRCLAKAPRDRYQTPAELINAIRSAMGLPPAELAAATPPPSAKVEKVAPPVTPPPSSPPAPSPSLASTPPPAPAKEQSVPPKKAEPPPAVKPAKAEEVAVVPPAEKQAPPARQAPPQAAPQIRCPHCGQTIPATERFCPRCGRPLAAKTPPPPSSGAGAPALLKAAHVVVRAGPERGKTYTIEAEVRIGRGSGNDIALSDPRASRRHSQITRQGSQFILVDLGSSNGTLVNNKRIQAGYALKEGDVIKLGETEMVFHF